MLFDNRQVRTMASVRLASFLGKIKFTKKWRYICVSEIILNWYFSVSKNTMITFEYILTMFNIDYWCLVISPTNFDPPSKKLHDQTDVNVQGVLHWNVSFKMVPTDICKLDFVWRYLHIPEVKEFECHQPVFKKGA